MSEKSVMNGTNGRTGTRCKRDGWVKKKLGEVCEIKNGFAFKSSLFSDTGNAILRISNIQGGEVVLDNTAYFKDTTYSVDLDKYKVIPNDIVMALSGATTGKIGINNTLVTFYLNQRVALFREKSSLNHRYLLYYLKTIAEEVLKNAGGAAQPNISTEKIKTFSINVPTLTEQQHIVSELDCLNGIIEKQKEQLKQLDELAQSIFYDMFGDPVENEKGWEVHILKKLTSKIGSGATPKGGNESYKDHGISLIRSLNVHNNLFKVKDLAFIDEEQADTLKNVIVQKDDVLLNITGASVARCCLVPESLLPARVNQHVAILRPLQDRLNSNFMSYMLTSASYQQLLLMQSRSNGATREALTKTQLQNLKVILPPLSLQQAFASKIEAIEHQKELIKQSLAETENLFNSRMDYYFG